MTNGSLTQTEGAGASPKTNHTVQIDRRRHTTITGVSDVCSFHETEIVLKIDSGLMILTGQNLHIAKLLLEDGRLDVDGHVDGIVYEAPKAQARRLLFGKWRKQ